MLPVHNQREVFLTEDQIQALMHALADSPNRELKPFVQLSILLGTRKNELVQAVWADVDTERHRFRVPPQLAKNGKERFIPLSQTAMSILAGLPRRGPWLLPNPKTRQPYVSFYHAWDTARKAAQVPHCRWHDLRHTAASLMASQGQSLFVIGQILGHANPKVTQRYAQLTDEALRGAVEAAARASGL
jgi:integrase